MHLVLQSWLNEERAVTSREASTPTTQGSQQEYSSERSASGSVGEVFRPLVRALQLQKKTKRRRKVMAERSCGAPFGQRGPSGAILQLSNYRVVDIHLVSVKLSMSDSLQCSAALHASK